MNSGIWKLVGKIQLHGVSKAIRMRWLIPQCDANAAVAVTRLAGARPRGEDGPRRTANYAARAPCHHEEGRRGRRRVHRREQRRGGREAEGKPGLATAVLMTGCGRCVFKV